MWSGNFAINIINIKNTKLSFFALLIPLVISNLVLSSCSYLVKHYLPKHDALSSLSESAVILNIHPIKQRSPEECGLTAVTMLMSYYGVELDASVKTGLEEYARVNGGISGKELVDTLMNSGFETYVFAGSIDNKPTGIYHHLNKRRPLIIMLSPKNEGSMHYVIIVGYDIESKKIVILDPSIGLSVLPLNTFTELWTKANRFALLAMPVISEADKI